MNQGRGPIRIRYESRQKGVEHLIDDAMDAAQTDWFDSALNCAKRKFPRGITYEERAKAYRFLSYRGFDSDSIQYTIKELLVK